MKNTTICLVGARAGSKRIPNKNLRALGGTPLIAHTLILTQKLRLPTFVSTDSWEIGRVAAHYGAYPIERPANLASDVATDYDWVTHALGEIKKKGQEPTRIAFLRPTTPLRDEIVIKTCLDTFRKENSSLRSVEPISEPLEKHFWCKGGILEAPFTDLTSTNKPSQVFPKAYKANGYIDILLPSTIAHGDLYGDKIQAFITPHTVEIDTIEELEYAEYLYQKNFKTYSGTKKIRA